MVTRDHEVTLGVKVTTNFHIITFSLFLLLIFQQEVICQKLDNDHF
jgi:hypothetical protein